MEKAINENALPAAHSESTRWNSRSLFVIADVVRKLLGDNGACGTD
jgi:hypothetical protein